jgi:hypothetical protein
LKIILKKKPKISSLEVVIKWRLGNRKISKLEAVKKNKIMISIMQEVMKMRIRNRKIS